MIAAATPGVVVDVLGAAHDQLLRRPDLLAALRAWKRPAQVTTVCGLGLRARVRFELRPGAWRFGRVMEWEPSATADALSMARVELERLDRDDPREVRRTRSHLMPVPEVVRAAP